MKRTAEGSCHCGAVRFEADVDLSEGTSRCNCSICSKTRFWSAVVAPDEFRLLQGADALTDYQIGPDTVHHRFRSRCGVKPYGRGEDETLGGEFYAVNVACLDDTTDGELTEASIAYVDGRHGRTSPPASTRHL